MTWKLFKNNDQLFLLLFWQGNIKITPLANKKTLKKWTKLELAKKKLQILNQWENNLAEFIEYLENDE